ncbi:putative RNA-directed DNA polymerase [Rosa chinensis]|uniref:Putative RNA-directed DNA polymerase n=1 Tax=Rosa chinensis TaxID=74649 RepID=A0A2P6P7C7_ROSCH|nr:putative RNA-directed DNA polymerase [Rosa chinensis]
MMREFDMTDMGSMSYFLGIEVIQKPGGNFIFQRRYVLKRFGMMGSNMVTRPIVPGSKIGRDKYGVTVDETDYKQLVGSLMYLTSTRPDLMFVTTLLSIYMAKPNELHLQAAKRVLRYLKGTVDYDIYYKNEGGDKLMAFTDSGYAGDMEDSKSTSGYVFLLSSGAISWSSKKQPIVTLSTTEAKFVAATMCVCQAIWLKRIVKELGHEEEDCTYIKYDNTSTIKLSKNQCYMDAASTYV